MPSDLQSLAQDLAKSMDRSQRYDLQLPAPLALGLLTLLEPGLASVPPPARLQVWHEMLRIARELGRFLMPTPSPLRDHYIQEWNAYGLPPLFPDQAKPASVIWVVYDHPTDIPHYFVARQHRTYADGSTDVDPTAHTFDTLDHARAWLAAKGLLCLGRQEGDDPKIVESWT